jgi:hypothetical protein
MSTLYPAMVNSPVTELAAAIDAVATTITVLNGAALPDAPNIATIGQGENAETVMYAAKSGNTLSSVTRGFQGTARTWPISSKIARNFTAYDYDTIRTMLDEGQTIPAPISRGVNVIQSDQASGATFNVRGCTLCNVLGPDGGCESLTPFAVTGGGTDELSSFNGIKSIKMTATASNAQVRYKDYNYQLDSGKYYILGCWVQVDAFTSGGASLSLRDKGTSTVRYAVNVNTSLVGSPQFIYVKVPISNTLVGSGFRLQFGPGSVGAMVVHYGAIRLYEISAADYAAIGTTITGEAIDRRWPYVDSVQHTRGLSVLMPGKNLLKGVPDNTQGTTNLISPYNLELPAGTTGDHNIEFFLDVTPNTQYTLKADKGGTPARSLVLTTTLAEIASTTNEVLSFNSGVNTRIRIRLTKQSIYTGLIIFKDWMLVIGGADQLPASFTPYNPTYANVDTTLASNVDRSVADSYDSATGQVFRRWITGVKFDGSNNVGGEGIYTGYKRIWQTLPTPLNSTNSALQQNAVRFDGVVLSRFGAAPTAPDQFIITISDNRFYCSVPHSISGWSDSISLHNANIIKALLNGWKANGNNSSVYNSWVSILTGAAPATNTEAYVAANKAPGWDAYATLDYVRATPITELLTGDVGGLNVVKGGNTVELLEGVIVREKANPVASIGLYGINRFTETSKLGYRADRIIAIYKGGVKDDKWTFGAHTSQTSVYGNQWATIPTADYDPAAEYFVDYITLDKYAYTANAVDATLVYRSTLGGAVAQATQDIAKLQQHNGVQDFALDYIEAKADNNAHDLVQRNGYGTTAGTATAYTLTLTPAPQLVEGMRVMVKLHADSGANPTLNVNGTGAQAIRKPNGSAPAAGLLKSGSVYTLVFNGTAFILQGEGGEYGTATASEVLAGKTIGTDAGLVTGTIPHYKGHTEAAYVEPNPGGTRLFMMPYIGYYDAGFNNTWVYRDDPNFIASNIHKNSSIFGLAGTLQPYDLVEPGDYQLAIVNQTEVSRSSITLFPTGSPIYVNVPGTYRISFTLRANISSAAWGQLWWTANGAGNNGFIGQEYFVPEGNNSQTFTQDILLNPTGYTNFSIYIALRGVSESFYVQSSNLIVKCAVKPYVSLSPL